VRPSAAIRRLLTTPLDSFEKLEIVIALYKAPARTSSVAELATQCGLAVEVATRVVEELAGARFVDRSSGLIRLSVGSDDLAAITELVEVYDDDRIVIIRALSMSAMDKIRGMAARTFAAAFKIRRKRRSRDEDG
jgi:hypothetical protein